MVSALKKPSAKRRDTETFYVYAMFDPRDNRVRYIGVSNNPERRVKRQISHSHDADVRAWVAALKTEGVTPGHRILDSAEGQLYGHWAEKWWIGMYSFVCPGQLLNKAWKSDFYHLYKLDLDARLMRKQQEQEALEERNRLHRLAVERAREMVRSGRDDVKQIAAECGIVTILVWHEVWEWNRLRDAAG